MRKLARGGATAVAVLSVVLTTTPGASSSH
jgi:hypothetical protein